MDLHLHYCKNISFAVLINTQTHFQAAFPPSGRMTFLEFAGRLKDICSYYVVLSQFQQCIQSCTKPENMKCFLKVRAIGNSIINVQPMVLFVQARQCIRQQQQSISDTSNLTPLKCHVSLENKLTLDLYWQDCQKYKLCSIYKKKTSALQGCFVPTVEE